MKEPEKKQVEENKKIPDKSEPQINEDVEGKVEAEKIKEEKKAEKKDPNKMIKKDEAFINIKNSPISTKYSIDICRFIKYKPINNAINDLEQVLIHKKAIPMKGEYAHRKGKIMSGKYPLNATKYFIRLLKSLSANSEINGLTNPIIIKAVSNKAPSHRARFGSWKRKLTHITIIAKDKKFSAIKKDFKVERKNIKKSKNEKGGDK